MICLIKFEIKKMLSSKKNLISLMILAIFCAGFSLMSNSIDQQFIKSNLTNIESNIESLNTASSDIKEELNNLKDNVQLKKIYASYTEELALLNDLKESYIQNDYQKFLKIQIALDENLLKQIENKEAISSADPTLLNSEILKNKLLLERNLKPINDDVSIQGFNFIKVILNATIVLIFMMFSLIISSSLISSEYEDNTYKLFFTQPVSKMKILFSKIIAAILFVNISIFLVLLLIFLASSAINGFGASNYPTLFYSASQNAYIDILKYDMFALLLLFIILSANCILGICLSTATKNTSASISIALIIASAFYGLSTKGFLTKIAAFNPFTYIDISGTLNGNLSSINPNINFTNGILVNSIFLVIYLSISILLFKKHLSK